MTRLASIVIPVYNGMPFLPQALASALAQDHHELEVVVIENGSTDGTSDWLRERHDPRLRVVYRERTQPAGDNWTQAVAESRGDFVKLMCADDLIEPDAVSRQVAAILSNPDVVMAASRRRIIDAHDRVLKSEHGLGSRAGVIDGRAAIRDCCLAGTNTLGEPAAVLFVGEVIRTAMPWDGRWPYMIDVATYTKVLRQGPIMCDRSILASFRVSSGSWSSALLEEQPIQFRGWRDHIVASGDFRWSRMDAFRSECALQARTAGRRLYFRRVARAANRARS